MKEKREAPMSPSLMIAIGFALLILLMLYATWNDISRIIFHT